MSGFEGRRETKFLPRPDKSLPALSSVSSRSHHVDPRSIKQQPQQQQTIRTINLRIPGQIALIITRDPRLDDAIVSVRLGHDPAHLPELERDRRYVQTVYLPEGGSEGHSSVGAGVRKIIMTQHGKRIIGIGFRSFTKKKLITVGHIIPEIFEQYNNNGDDDIDNVENDGNNNEERSILNDLNRHDELIDGIRYEGPTNDDGTNLVQITFSYDHDGALTNIMGEWSPSCDSSATVQRGVQLSQRGEGVRENHALSPKSAFEPGNIVDRHEPEHHNSFAKRSVQSVKEVKEIKDMKDKKKDEKKDEKKEMIGIKGKEKDQGHYKSEISPSSSVRVKVENVLQSSITRKVLLAVALGCFSYVSYDLYSRRNKRASKMLTKSIPIQQTQQTQQAQRPQFTGYSNNHWAANNMYT
jgi:hypothetical protein